MGCLYLITGPDGRQYVGLTTKSAEARWRKHSENAKYGRPGMLYDAMREHGPSAFVVETLLEAERDVLCWAEGQEIAERGLQDPALGFNQTAGGDGKIGVALHRQQGKTTC